MKNKNNLKVNYKISLLKHNALKLRANYQLPYVLVLEITKINKETDVNLVKYLMAQSEHMLRIKGYYKKFPTVEKECNEMLKKEIASMTLC